MFIRRIYPFSFSWAPKWVTEKCLKWDSMRYYWMSHKNTMKALHPYGNKNGEYPQIMGMSHKTNCNSQKSNLILYYNQRVYSLCAQSPILCSTAILPDENTFTPVQSSDAALDVVQPSNMGTPHKIKHNSPTTWSHDINSDPGTLFIQID